jgi:hypothetical protein
VTSHHSITHTLALALAALACATLVNASAAADAAASRQSAVQIVRVSSRGFDWRDAGIGAAAGIGLSMLAVGAVLLLSGTRQPSGMRTRKESI